MTKEQLAQEYQEVEGYTDQHRKMFINGFDVCLKQLSEAGENEKWFCATITKETDISHVVSACIYDLKTGTNTEVIDIRALAASNAKVQELTSKLERAEKALERLSQSGDGTCGDKKASFYDCLPTLQIEFDERKEFAAQTLKEIRGGK